MKFRYSWGFRYRVFFEFFFKPNSFYTRFPNNKKLFFRGIFKLNFKFFRLKRFQKRVFFFKKKKKRGLKAKEVIFYKNKFPKIMKLFFKTRGYFYNWDVSIKNYGESISKKKFNIFVNFFFINFLRKIFYLKFNLLFTNSCFLPKFFLKKLKYFISKNKRYIRVLKNFVFFKNFYFLFFFTIFYKNITILSGFIKKFVSSIPLKKQRFFYYFLRFNITKFFRTILKKFFIAGFFLRIRGKYATFSGGRRKLFYIKYSLNTKSNYNLVYKFRKTKHSTKLGAFGLKILILFF